MAGQVEQGGFSGLSVISDLGTPMRYTPDHKEKTRARILESAATVFRRQGYHATGVDKVMEEAGLTAGGFYAHFPSKDALLAEALEHYAAKASGKLDRRAGRSSRAANGSARWWIATWRPRIAGVLRRDARCRRWRPR